VPIRICVPGGLTGGNVGRIYVIHYPDSITLELAQQAQGDYVEFAKSIDAEKLPVLMISDKPFPLAPTEVRAYWREVADKPGFECIALVIGGVVGLMAAAVTHLGEQLVAVLGVRFRTFRDTYEGAAWLCQSFDAGGATPDEIVEFVGEMRARHADALGSDND
jgi:hypothetical protein